MWSLLVSCFDLLGVNNGSVHWARLTADRHHEINPVWGCDHHGSHVVACYPTLFQFKYLNMDQCPSHLETVSSVCPFVLHPSVFFYIHCLCPSVIHLTMLTIHISLQPSSLNPSFPKTYLCISCSVYQQLIQISNKIKLLIVYHEVLKCVYNAVMFCFKV